MRNDKLILAAVFVLTFVGGIALNLAEDEISTTSEVSDHPDVVLITVNNMRADHMPCYGYERNTTPNICEFADDNVEFTNAWAQSSWTLPSMASVFLSQYPETHKVTTGRNISTDAVTMTEVFGNQGYETGGFVGNRKCQGGHMKSLYGYDQGFDTYHERGPWFNTSVPRSIDWLESRESEYPFFLFVHGYDAHSPYGDMDINRSFGESYDGVLKNYTLDFGRTDDEYILDNLERRDDGTTVARLYNDTVELTEEDLDYVRSRYDSDLAAADRSIGRLLNHIQSNEEYDDTIIVLMSNHGTMLGNRGPGDNAWGHGFPYEEIVKAPLIIRAPDYEGRSIDTPVELVDIYPTLMDVAGIETSAPKRIQGRSLNPLIEGKGKSKSGYAFSEGTGSSTFAIRNSDWKLISTRTSEFGSDELYYKMDGERPVRIEADKVPQSVKTQLKNRLSEWKEANQNLEDSSSQLRPTGGCNDNIIP